MTLPMTWSTPTRDLVATTWPLSTETHRWTRSSACKTTASLPEGLGLYNIRTILFDTQQNGVPTVTRETFCTGDGCAIRTRQTPVQITVDSFYFSVGALGLELVFNDQTSYASSTLARLFDRGPVEAPISGQCSRAIVENTELRVRLDAAAGAVGTSCIINGYYD